MGWRYNHLSASETGHPDNADPALKWYDDAGRLEASSDQCHGSRLAWRARRLARDAAAEGLVVPAELLQSHLPRRSYAEFLLEPLSEITLGTFELVFDGILQEVVLFCGVVGPGPAHIHRQAACERSERFGGQGSCGTGASPRGEVD